MTGCDIAFQGLDNIIIVVFIDRVEYQSYQKCLGYLFFSLHQAFNEKKEKNK